MRDDAPVALPSNVTYGTVIGRFLIATADSPDDTDRDPQGIPATDLKITFSPNLSPAVARDGTATPPTFFALADVPATIGPDGSLLGPDGQPGVKLVASTNPALNPTGWTWSVRMIGTGYPTITFSFLLDGAQTIDLGTVLQVPSNPAATLTQWMQAVADAQAARDAAIAAAASVPSAASLSATYVALRGPWVAGTAFPKNSLVIQSGAVYLAAADVPARATFTVADWQALGGGAAVADLILTLIGAGVAGLAGTALNQSGVGVATANSTLLTTIGGGVARIAA